jgi:hypothetical protein
MSYQERPDIEMRSPVRVDVKEQSRISAKIERTALPVDKMTDLIFRMHGHWCLPEGKNQKKDDVDVVQKWIRLCHGYLKSGDSFKRLKNEGAVRPADIEPIMCRSYLEKVYEGHNGRNDVLAVLNLETVQAANRAFEALIGDGNVRMFFGDPGSAKDLWYKCFMHHVYRSIFDSTIPVQIFPDQLDFL